MGDVPNDLKLGADDLTKAGAALAAIQRVSDDHRVDFGRILVWVEGEPIGAIAMDDGGRYVFDPADRDDS